MERCANCEICGIRISYDPDTNSWGPAHRVWRATCVNKALTESNERAQTDCPDFDRTLARLVY